MKSTFSACSTFLAAFCAFLFVVLASGILIVFIANHLLFNAVTYKQALRDQQVYDRFPELIAEQLIFQQEQRRLGKDTSREIMDPTWRA